MQAVKAVADAVREDVNELGEMLKGSVSEGTERVQEKVRLHGALQLWQRGHGAGSGTRTPRTTLPARPHRPCRRRPQPSAQR